VDAPEDTVEVEELPPADIRGTETHTIETVVFNDTSERDTLDLTHLTIDRSDQDKETATARVKKDSTTAETTFKLPEEGEELMLFVDSIGDLQAMVDGAPARHEEKAITSTIDKPWYMDLWERIELLFAIVFGGALLYAALRLVPWA